MIITCRSAATVAEKTFRRRILISAFGSAGDLFPLIPSVLSLIADGHDVRCAVPRGLGLYLRSLGIPTVSLGSGAELNVVRDSDLFTNRFDGWSSWRRTLNHYVAPTLKADVATLAELLDEWRPNLVVATGFSCAARLAAEQAGVHTFEASIYPQHIAAAETTGRFAPELLDQAEALASGSRPSIAFLLGLPADTLLHDPALLGESSPAAVGFPYWDALVGESEETRRVHAFLSQAGPSIVVTQGSFVGLAREETWMSAASAVKTLGARAVFIGAAGSWSRETFGPRKDILCTGFVPLREAFGAADAAVHHGGIGTTFAAVLGECPSVVLPQAFDQGRNAALVQRAGVGLDGRGGDLAECLGAILGNTAMRGQARTLADELIPSDVAAQNLVSQILASAGGE